jgi:hypothetical protein
MADLSKILQQESEGIMFPFKTGVQSTTTEQQVYDSTTDGIMTVQGQQYSLPEYQGPTATIQYGTEEQGYPRMLREIEQGELPQFRQEDFPKAGEGRTEISTPTTQPITTTPFEPTTPAVDPCPAGFKYDPVKGVCVPVKKPQDSDRQEFTNKPRDIGDTAQALSQITDVMQEQGIGTFGQDVNYKIDNSSILSKLGPLGKLVDKFLIKDPADRKLQKLSETEGINVIENKDGTYNVKITENGKTNFGRLQTKESLSGNLASTQKTDAQGNIIKAPNGKLMIQGPLTLSAFGKTDLFTPTTRTKKEVDALNVEEKNKLLSELDAALGIDRTAITPTEEIKKDTTTVKDTPKVTEDFGTLKGLSDFGALIRDNEVAKLNIEDANVTMDMIESQYQTGKVSFGSRDSDIDREKDKKEKAKKQIKENNKKIDEKIEELGMSDSQAQDQGFKDSREQFEYRVKASQEASKRAENKRTSQSQFTGGQSFKGGATATGTTRCFHPDTNINGTKIKDIKAGDYINDSLVEGMVQFKMNNPYYLIDGVKVSGSHGVLHNNKWLFVADHPEAKEVEDVTEFVYVPIVEGGTFKINNTTYADYDYHDIVVLGDDEWKKRRGFI